MSLAKKCLNLCRTDEAVNVELPKNTLKDGVTSMKNAVLSMKKLKDKSLDGSIKELEGQIFSLNKLLK